MESTVRIACRFESYSPVAENAEFGDGDIPRLLELNSARAQWHQDRNYDWVLDTRNGRAYANARGRSTLDVFTHASLERPMTQRTLEEETFEGQTTSLVVATGDRVVYIPWSDGWRDLGRSKLITPGKSIV
jgi:hypothetical protein